MIDVHSKDINNIYIWEYDTIICVLQLNQETKGGALVGCMGWGWVLLIPEKEEKKTL
jgi:hypothetical protein